MAPTTIFLAEVFISALCGIPLLLAMISRQGTLRAVPWNFFGVLSGGCLALGLLLYYLALEIGPVSIVVPLTATYPVIAVLLGYSLLNEKPSLAQWIGVVLITAGVILLLSGNLTTDLRTDIEAREASHH